MTAPPSRRPWWRRKRTWAALAIWLVLPAGYVVAYRELMQRRQVTRGATSAVFFRAEVVAT